MSLDWHAFTPGASLAGGLLIGLASALLLAGVGRIAGIAGIVAGLLQAVLGRPGHRAAAWAGQGLRLGFLAGLLLAPLAWSAFAPLPAVQDVAGPGGLLAAGFLVGVGVRMANGCTSGHGVCGLARGARRSLANVLAFMGAGAATVFALRHLIG